MNVIRFVKKNQDYEGWKKLYLQYGEFYQVPMTMHDFYRHVQHIETLFWEIEFVNENINLKFQEKRR